MNIAAAKICTATILIVALAKAPATVAESMPEIPHQVQPRADLLIGGQPEPEHLEQARDAGVRTVINLRSNDDFDDWVPAQLLRDLGMLYIHIPVGEAGDLNPDSVAAFDRALQAKGEDPALVHCASGNRVGAMYALRAAWIQGEDKEDALAIGREHGLGGLEEQVREKLSTIDPSE